MAKREGVYAWEHRIFGDLYARLVPPDLRVALTHALARAFEVPCNGVDLILRRPQSGKCFQRARRIELPVGKYPVSVGVIVHEIAHQYAYERGYHGHHGKPWRDAFLKLGVRARPGTTYGVLERCWAEAEAQVQRDTEAAVARAQAVSVRLQRQAASKAAAAAQRRTAEHRLAQVRVRIKRLESRVRSLTTRLKSARRSEAALARVVAAKVLRATAPSPAEIAAAEARLVDRARRINLPAVCATCHATTPGNDWVDDRCPACGAVAQPAPEGRGA